MMMGVPVDGFVVRCDAHCNLCCNLVCVPHAVRNAACATRLFETSCSGIRSFVQGSRCLSGPVRACLHDADAHSPAGVLGH